MHDGQPGLRERDAELGLVELEGVRLDARDPPPVAEGGTQFIPADPPGPEGPRLAVTEAQQVTVAAISQHRRQAGHVPDAVFVVEDMEDPAVDDRAEGQAEVSGVQRVGDFEAGVQASFEGLAAGPLDGKRRQVDTHRVRPVRGGEQGLLTGAATGIQQPPGQQSFVRQPHEGRLRPADVPWRGRIRRVGGVPARRRHCGSMLRR